jgi:hypothetical protein
MFCSRPFTRPVQDQLPKTKQASITVGTGRTQRHLTSTNVDPSLRLSACAARNKVLYVVMSRTCLKSGQNACIADRIPHFRFTARWTVLDDSRYPQCSMSSVQDQRTPLQRHLQYYNALKEVSCGFRQAEAMVGSAWSL